MKIRKMTLYAVQIIERMYLEGETVITSKSISETENIPQGVVMKILLRLKHAGVVDSHQGRGVVSGGYTLAQSVKELTLYDIFVAMETEIYLHASFREQEYGKEFEYIYKELDRINDNLISELKRYSLYELVKGSVAIEEKAAIPLEN